MEPVTIDTIKQDVVELQKAANDAAALIETLSSDTSVSQDQLDNLHAALLDVTKTLTDATGATASR